MKYPISKITLLVLAASSIMVGCAPNISPDVVQANNANEVTNTVQGKIVSMRTVQVKGNGNEIGTLIGAATGAVAGSAIGGGNRVPILTGIGGAVLGGAAGNMVQDKLTTQSGIEYVVKLDNTGNLITIVQGAGAQKYQVGQSVYVVEGAHARILGVA